MLGTPSILGIVVYIVGDADDARIGLVLERLAMGFGLMICHWQDWHGRDVRILTSVKVTSNGASTSESLRKVSGETFRRVSKASASSAKEHASQKTNEAKGKAGEYESAGKKYWNSKVEDAKKAADHAKVEL